MDTINERTDVYRTLAPLVTTSLFMWVSLASYPAYTQTFTRDYIKKQSRVNVYVKREGLGTRLGGVLVQVKSEHGHLYGYDSSIIHKLCFLINGPI